MTVVWALPEHQTPELDPVTKEPPRVLVEVFNEETTTTYVTVAEYVPKNTILFDDYCDRDAWVDMPDTYDEDIDDYWTPEGWYEWCSTQDVKLPILDVVVAWCPLPASLVRR